MMFLEDLYDEDKIVIHIADNTEFSGVKQRTCAHKYRFSSQVVQFLNSFMLLVLQVCGVSRMENWT